MVRFDFVVEEMAWKVVKYKRNCWGCIFFIYFTALKNVKSHYFSPHLFYFFFWFLVFYFFPLYSYIVIKFNKMIFKKVTSESCIFADLYLHDWLSDYFGHITVAYHISCCYSEWSYQNTSHLIIQLHCQLHCHQQIL